MRRKKDTQRDELLDTPLGDHIALDGDRVEISVLIPVHNEERHIRKAVAAMQAQQLDGNFELLFADGGSSDQTRPILLELAQADRRIRVLDNPRGHTASGLNVCLRAARGEFVARMDAHTFYPDRYLVAGIERLRRGDTDWVSGPQVPEPTGPVSRAVSIALSSWFGQGGSRKWDSMAAEGGEHELDTGVFGGVWSRRSVLDIGGWDERWPINQDSEMAARYLERGARLVCISEMAASYVPRNSLPGLARQYFRYGMYRARTFHQHPSSMRRSHLLAPALAGALLASAVAPRPLRKAARLAMVSYAGAVGATAVSTAMRPRERPGEAALLAAVLPTMHFAWGFGTLVGVLRFGVPVQALARSVGIRVTAQSARDVRDVYAPSLHDRDD